MMQVLYIAGAGRSGSTLIEMSLGALPDYFSVGEVRYFWQYVAEGGLRCGCGALLGECDFWSHVLARLPQAALGETARLAARIDRTRNLPRLSVSVLSPGAAGQRLAVETDRLYRAIWEEGGQAVIVDSSKVPSHLALLRRLPGIDLRVLHLVRDGRAVAYSWSKRRKRELAATQPGARMPGRSALTALAVWGIENSFAHRLSHGLPYAMLRYEDFVREPAGALGDALVSLGFERPSFTHLQCKEAVQLQPTHSVGGNPLRFLDKQLTIRADEEWRCHYHSLVRLGLGLLAMPWLLRYQYKL